MTEQLNWTNLSASEVEVKSLSHVWLFVTPWTVAGQDPLSMGFSRQEYWSGLPCPPPGDLSDSGMEPAGSWILSQFMIYLWPLKVVVVQSINCVWLSATPMKCSTTDFCVLHYLPEFAQTHVRWISDVIHPSHPLSHPSPPALNLSQRKGLFYCVSSLHQVAKVLELQH